MKRSRRRAGFTLLEVLVVMAILIIMMSVAYLTMQAWYGDTRVKAAADEVRGAWANARAHAIEEGVNYRFAVNFDSGRFKVGPDDTDHWQGSDDAKDTDSIGAGPLTLRMTLPKGIVFKSRRRFQRKPRRQRLDEPHYVLARRYLQGKCLHQD